MKYHMSDLVQFQLLDSDKPERNLSTAGRWCVCVRVIPCHVKTPINIVTEASKRNNHKLLLKVTTSVSK